MQTSAEWQSRCASACERRQTSHSQQFKVTPSSCWQQTDRLFIRAEDTGAPTLIQGVTLCPDSFQTRLRRRLRQRKCKFSHGRHGMTRFAVTFFSALFCLAGINGARAECQIADAKLEEAIL